MAKVISTDQLLYFKQKMMQLLDRKVSVEPGKGLSTNDLTTELLQKLQNAEAGGSASAALQAAKEYTDKVAGGKLATNLKGVAGGLAELDSTGKVPAAQLPSYVDDVLESNSKSAFPGTGETGKIYLAKDTNILYRWSGTQYVEISSSLALGMTASTAYRGDYGNAAYQHSISAHAPSNAEKNIVAGIQKNGVDLVPDSSTRKVNVTVPTKLSELQNDSGYVKTDTNTTYTFKTASNDAVNGSAKLRMTAGGSGSGTQEILIKGVGGTTVITDSIGNVVITSPEMQYADNTDVDNMFV